MYLSFLSSQLQHSFYSSSPTHFQSFTASLCCSWCADIKMFLNVETFKMANLFKTFVDVHLRWVYKTHFPEICPPSCKLASHVISGSVVMQLWSKTLKHITHNLMSVVIAKACLHETLTFLNWIITIVAKHFFALYSVIRHDIYMIIDNTMVLYGLPFYMHFN